jgi:hypothetical protein
MLHFTTVSESEPHLTYKTASQNKLFGEPCQLLYFCVTEKIEMQKLIRLLTIVVVEWYHSVIWLLSGHSSLI